MKNLLPPRSILRCSAFALLCFAWAPALLAEPVVSYAGGGANTRFHDTRELSDGTFLVVGLSNNLDWINASVQRTEIPISGVPAPSGTHISFFLRLSGDASEILEVVHLPPGAVANLRWLRSTGIPGQPTGRLYVSGQVPGGYFIAPLDRNFVEGRPSGFDWVRMISAAHGHERDQPWDVGSDGRVVYAYGGEYSAQIGFLNADGERVSLPELRASHWVNGGFERGVGSLFPDAEYSAIRLPTDNQSWNDTELFAITPDGNGGIRQGTWPIDITIRHSFETGEPVRVVNGTAYGYNGYRGTGRHWIGAVSVDRRNNHFYFGYNIQSIFFDTSPYSGPNGREQPDFEPAVIGYDDEGRMKWWNRLYTEAVDTTGDGQIDVTYTSPPDQYIDGLDVDYSVPLEEGGNVVVVARCHGNNTSNFWWGNQITLRPGASGFQNRFTGTEGNIHINYIARLIASDGNILAGTYVAGFFRRIISGKGNWPTQAYPEPIHDGWANHNAGWPDLTTTRIEANSARVGPDGRVYMVGVGPRMVTTSNAFQKLPRRLGHNNPILNEGTSPWNNWVRAYEPNLNALAYSSALTGVWTYPDGNIDAEAQGAGNVVLRGVWPVSGALLVVGQHSNGAGTSAAGNNMPTANVPAWGADAYNGITGVFGLMPFGQDRPRAMFSMEVRNEGRIDVDASTDDSAVLEYAWSFGDGATGTGAETTHTYAEPGTYLVGLTVTNTDGFAASNHRWVEITEVGAPPIHVPPVRWQSGALGARTLAFATQTGTTYRIQTSTTLDPDDWTDWGDPLEGTGAEVSVDIDALPTGSAVFYRIVITR